MLIDGDHTRDDQAFTVLDLESSNILVSTRCSIKCLREINIRDYTLFLLDLIGSLLKLSNFWGKLRLHELLHCRWHAVASWTWDAQDETCGICRMPFDGCCPDCKLPGDDCPLIWGACNHSFHLHCILKWVNSQTSQAHCPMCRREWQFKE
ncbi:hypothetical protein YC2023_025704 [Brassica napus]